MLTYIYDLIWGYNSYIYIYMHLLERNESGYQLIAHVASNNEQNR